MVIVPPIPFRGRRRRILPTAAPLPPLNIVSAELYSSSPDDVEIRPAFDTSEENPLVEILAADPGKWWCRIDGFRYVGATIEPVSFDVVRVFFVIGPAEAGETVVAYTNSPSDIQDASGRKLEAMTMPITIP